MACAHWTENWTLRKLTESEFHLSSHHFQLHQQPHSMGPLWPLMSPWRSGVRLAMLRCTLSPSLGCRTTGGAVAGLTVEQLVRVSGHALLPPGGVEREPAHVSGHSPRSTATGHRRQKNASEGQAHDSQHERRTLHRRGFPTRRLSCVPQHRPKQDVLKMARNVLRHLRPSFPPQAAQQPLKATGRPLVSAVAPELQISTPRQGGRRAHGPHRQANGRSTIE